jgi:hypothetical protein
MIFSGADILPGCEGVCFWYWLGYGTHIMFPTLICLASMYMPAAHLAFGFSLLAVGLLHRYSLHPHPETLLSKLMVCLVGRLCFIFCLCMGIGGENGSHRVFFHLHL